MDQGKENARQFLKDNPDIADGIDRKLRAEMMPKPVARPSADEETLQEAAEE